MSKVNDWIHRLLLVLRDALDELQVLPERDAHALAHIVPDAPPLNNALRCRFDQLETAMDDWMAQANLTG